MSVAGDELGGQPVDPAVCQFVQGLVGGDLDATLTVVNRNWTANYPATNTAPETRILEFLGKLIMSGFLAGHGWCGGSRVFDQSQDRCPIGSARPMVPPIRWNG